MPARFAGTEKRSKRFMITAAKLRNHTVKDLAAMAKGEGVCGWHAMRKEQLIKALLKLTKEEASSNAADGRNNTKLSVPTNGSSTSRDSDGRFKSVHSAISASNHNRLQQIREKLAAAKNLAHKAEKDRVKYATDRLVLTVRDPYWLHVYWELTPQSIQRAQVALGRHWHAAEPVLRLIEIGQNDTDPATKQPLRDIVIHGSVNNWYLDVTDPPRSFQTEIGYRTADGRFLCLARSNVVSTAIKDVFEKHPQRTLPMPMMNRFGLGAQNTGESRDQFSLEVDAEVVLFGVAEPGSQVTLKGQPIATREDGTFTIRFPLPDRRQVFPVVANSGDGMEQRTVVLAVERNTKVMAPVLRDPTE